jgi:HSP20 family protein
MKLTRNKKHNIRNESKGWVEHNFDHSGLFDDFVTRDFFRPSFSTTGVSTPAVNISETTDDFRLEMVAPGMRKEAFIVELEGDVLTVSYDHQDNREGRRDNIKYITREYNYYSFARSFSLPETVDGGNIQARYENGILTIIIPKKEEARGKPVRQIKIS